MQFNQVILGDCLDILKKYSDNSVDLVYLDPPFFTGKLFKGISKDNKTEFSFSDIWKNSSEYTNFLFERLILCYKLLKDTGSIVVHCDRNSVHMIRLILDSIFGQDNFQSEIIWAYKRWSNAKKGLLNQHQNLLFYSKTKDFKWNTQFTEYSPSTNLDQIFQKRERDNNGKSVYAYDENGDVINNGAKKGVPLGDVWDIPYLNPKAKERTGYPTQKPLILLERIIQLLTDENDIVLDPFCGSGTTLVAAKLLNRQYAGIDISEQAIDLCHYRLDNPVKTHSNLMEIGIKAYQNNNEWVESHLFGFDYLRVQRNNGLDATLKQELNGKMVFIKVQDKNETMQDAYFKMQKSLAKKSNCIGILIQTQSDLFSLTTEQDIRIIKSPLCQFNEVVS